MKEEEYISSLLDNLKKQEHLRWYAPYQLPTHYFNGLNTTLLNAIKEDSAENPGLLSTLSKKPLFKIPEAYFERLEGTIFFKLKIFTGKRAISLKQWYRIAAAAVITGILLLSIIKNLPETTHTEKKYSDAEMQHVSSDELAGFVNDNTNITGSPNTIDEDQLFNNISSQELQNFLNETGTDGILN